MQDIGKLQRGIAYHFNDLSLLQRALTHKSANIKHNERLEYLGDAILNFVIAEVLYRRFQNATEGELTRARASLVNKTSLSELAIELDLGNYLHLGQGEMRSGGFRRESILADAFEAMMGAIYLDSDYLNCYQCISRWFEKKLAVLHPKLQFKDPKTRLQEWLQANQKALPQYTMVSVIGEPHAQIFTVRCEIEGVSECVTGAGTNRRFAEQEAANKMLEMINAK